MNTPELFDFTVHKHKYKARSCVTVCARISINFWYPRKLGDEKCFEPKKSRFLSCTRDPCTRHCMVAPCISRLRTPPLAGLCFRASLLASEADSLRGVTVRLSVANIFQSLIWFRTCACRSAASKLGPCSDVDLAARSPAVEGSGCTVHCHYPMVTGWHTHPNALSQSYLYS